jgi:hypothetical protein
MLQVIRKVAASCLSRRRYLCHASLLGGVLSLYVLVFCVARRKEAQELVVLCARAPPRAVACCARAAAVVNKPGLG